MMENAGSSAQRIRIGLTGLAFAFLLVLLGSAISRRSGDDRGVGNGTTSSAENQPTEPLAELGVAPGGADIGANNASSNR